MNYAMIRYIIGWILNFEAAFMSPSFVVGLIYREKSAWAIFAIDAALSGHQESPWSC